MSARVRFEPLGEEIDCGTEETVLDAAFRQGYNLAYGCREGQCSACKCYLLEGEVELERYSSFALSESERGNGYALMCRARPESDLVVELLHYDPDNYRLEHAIREGVGTVTEIRELTPDIVGVTLEVQDLSFLPGQYLDIHIPGADPPAKRSFSIANLPGEGKVELMIKRYPGGRLSAMLGNEIENGSHLRFTGPYGAFHLRRSQQPILMIAGGSGMAPIVALLRQLAHEDCERPIRFFYGARTERDLFALEEIGALGAGMADFRFQPVVGGFVHEAVDAYLASGELAKPDVYMCGPPPMLEAAEAMLDRHGHDPARIFQDKFTVSADADADAEAAAAAPSAPAGQAGAASRGSSDATRAQHDSGSPPVSEREFAWFEPRGRRATLYEDVTIDTQPSIHRHLRRGWPVSFADGRGTWNDASTALRCRDWFSFRDPGQQWERTFYQAGAAAERQIDSALRSAAEQGLLEDFAAPWVQFLRGALQIPAFVEHGLWFALATAARDALSDALATCMCLQAAMKQRSAQAIVLYAMDLEPHLGRQLSMETARATFLGEDSWQPTRRYLERLAATPDWGEVVFAANLCFEPLVGTLVRRELGTRAAAASGDTVTPVLARAATQEWEWARAWTVALSQFLLAEDDHNRCVLSGWMQDWMPLALEAMIALLPMAAVLGVDTKRAAEQVRDYASEMLRAAALPEVVELVGCGAGVPAPSFAGWPANQAGIRGAAAPPAGAGVAAAPPAGAGGASAGPAGAGVAAAPRAGAGVPQAPPPDPSAPQASYDFVGIVMAKSAEGDALARVLARRGGVEVIEQPSFWDIRAPQRLVIPYQQLSDELGYEIDAYSIQHEMSTHYGRMVATDESLMLFSDPTEAMEHLLT